MSRFFHYAAPHLGAGVNDTLNVALHVCIAQPESGAVPIDRAERMAATISQILNAAEAIARQYRAGGFPAVRGGDLTALGGAFERYNLAAVDANEAVAMKWVPKPPEPGQHIEPDPRGIPVTSGHNPPTVPVPEVIVRDGGTTVEVVSTAHDDGARYETEITITGLDDTLAPFNGIGGIEVVNSSVWSTDPDTKPIADFRTVPALGASFMEQTPEERQRAAGFCPPDPSLIAEPGVPQSPTVRNGRIAAADEVTPCPRCEGTGRYARMPGDDKPCAVCSGTGKLGPGGEPVAATTPADVAASIEAGRKHIDTTTRAALADAAAAAPAPTGETKTGVPIELPRVAAASTMPIKDFLPYAIQPNDKLGGWVVTERGEPAVLILLGGLRGEGKARACNVARLLNADYREQPYRVEPVRLTWHTGEGEGRTVHAGEAWALVGPGCSPEQGLAFGEDGRLKLQREADERNGSATLPPLNVTDNRIPCPRCGERQTSLMSKPAAAVESWECDLCRLRWERPREVKHGYHS